jgi:argininosuccinate lyase
VAGPAEGRSRYTSAVPFDPQYVSNVLGENFRDAQALFIRPLLRVHYAHLVMLCDQHIITEEQARLLRDALDAITVSALQQVSFDSTCEDLFFYVERLIAGSCGDDIAGRLHTARSRNDIDMTMYRMRQREFVAALLGASTDLRTVLLDLAAAHLHTVFAAHTHTQPAQPTTIAHYVLAVVEQLERDAARLRAAYAATNRCPLGACAITGTGFPIDRQATSDLLGFDGPTGNTYGSIATVDYLLESISAAAVMMTGLGRVLQDLLLWCTPEFGYLRLADGFVQCSSIMPQKRNPVALEHARSIASKAAGQSHAVFAVVHNTPFGDIVDTEDDLQPLVASALGDALRAVRLVTAAMRDARFDVGALERRAASGGTTLTELADHLVRQHGTSFRNAHAIAARLLPALAEGTSLSAALARASQDVLGTPLQYTDAQLAGILSPSHFVDVRTTPGGPAPAVTAIAIDDSRRRLAADQAWWQSAGDRLAVAERRLRDRAAAL